MRNTLCFAAALCALFVASASFGQDPFALRAGRAAAKEVRERPKLAPAPNETVESPASDVVCPTSGERLEGEVLEISGRIGVRVKLDAEERTLATSEIARIEPSVSEPFRRGCDALENGARSGVASEYRRALALFREARMTSSRRLEKEWATAKIAETLGALGRSEEAADEFLLLCRIDSYSGWLASIPLRWAEPRVAAVGASDFDAKAKEWLELEKNPSGRENPTGRLLAASYLLSSARYKSDAIAALRDLVVCEAPDGADPELVESCKTISLLATAQLWRANLIKKPTEREVERWARTVELLPPGLRVGPTFLVGAGYKALGRDEDAVRAFLYVASLATSDRVLAERATNEAADALDRLGDAESAKRLRDDAAVRFADGARSDDAI